MKDEVQVREIKPPAVKDAEVALADDQLTRIEGRIDSIENSLNSIKTYESRLNLAEARIQASVDLTDDIVGSANNLISTTEARIDKTLDNADMVLDHADFLSSTFLVILGLIITAAGVIVTWILGRRQELHMKEAIEKITEKLSKDNDFRDEFISALVSHEDLRENVNYSIQDIARQMIDDASGESSNSDFTEFKENLEYSDASSESADTPNRSFWLKIKGVFANEP